MESSKGNSSSAAPPFLAPPEIMATLELKASTISPSSARTGEESSADEFLGMLKRALPPGGIGGAPTPSYTTPTGELMGRTENESATYLSSSSACLDFFFQVVPDTPEETVVELLERAWREDKLTALKLIFHLRGVRGTGKSDRERFYHAAVWLHKKHPLTLRRNLAVVAEFGYFKDILEVLLRLVEGPEVQTLKTETKAHHKETMEKGKANAKRWSLIQKSREERKLKRKGKDPNASDKKEEETEKPETENPDLHISDSDDSEGFVSISRIPKVQRRSGYFARKGAQAREAKEAGTLKPREERVAASLEKGRAAKKAAASLRKDKKLDLAKRVTQLFYEDARFQSLYLQTAKLFANQLKEDLKALQEDRPLAISLAPKWAPSLDNSYDMRTLLCYAIAAQVFPKEAFPEYEGLDNENYGAIVRERLRKEVLVPLRKVLELPEVYMSARKWGDVNYRRVASVAMSNYKPQFLEHDEERFKKFLDDVKSGKEKLAAGALLPHEITKSAVNDSGELAEVADLQWKRMVEDMKKVGVGSLSNCIAVCDVSGSMDGEPMEVCIALGILLSDISQEPWKGHVITFSENPEIHLVQGETLEEKYAFTKKMNWGMNTNLQLVFEKILTMAQLNKLEQEKMVKRLFIFSDMEFDQASHEPWETDYHVICNKYRDAGYGSPPEIVFWNLRNTSSVPVVNSQQGVAMVSGFSKNLLKLFLEKGGIIDPITVMNAAIEGKEYAFLDVVD